MTRQARTSAITIISAASRNGAPGKRNYHPGYYAAFVRHPDGNNIEAVFHGANTRSAQSVVIKPVPAGG